MEGGNWVENVGQIIQGGNWVENVGQIIQSKENEFFWMIPRIFFFSHKCCVTSPCFSFDQENWYLMSIPHDGYGGISTQNDCIGLFLWTKGQSSLKQQYHVEVGIKTLDNEDRHIRKGETSSEYNFGSFNFLNVASSLYRCECFGRIKIFCRIERKKETKIVENEEITESLLCSSLENDKSKSKITSDEEENSELELRGVKKLAKNLENLLKNEWGSDVILKNSDHEFRAHMTILGARSPVFASMFQHDMKERKTGEVDISDCSTAEFKVFLQFLYSGSADMSSVNVLDLYYIADKYEVLDLKLDCVKCMKDNLSLDNFCDTIALSLRHCESDLQNFATEFFCRNMKGIVKTVQWQKYLIENPIQANELIIKGINA